MLHRVGKWHIGQNVMAALPIVRLAYADYYSLLFHECKRNEVAPGSTLFVLLPPNLFYSTALRVHRLPPLAECARTAVDFSVVLC